MIRRSRFLSTFIQPLGGATQHLHSRKHSIWRVHLRTRIRLSSFPALERKRQDGPSAALLESPEKIRSGVPFLVSVEFNLSFIIICTVESQSVGVCRSQIVRIYPRTGTTWKPLVSQYGGGRCTLIASVALALCLISSSVAMISSA